MGLGLGVALACLLTHAREVRANCTLELRPLELVSVTAGGQPVADLTPWRSQALTLMGTGPGSMGLLLTPGGGDGQRVVSLQPVTP